MTTNITSSNGWTLNRTLGVGGFGIVQLWVHVQSGKKLAIKKCKWDYSQLTPIQRKRWANEVDIMRQLRHPNIVRTECIPFKLPDIQKSLPILSMEYCTKGNLRKILNQPENCCGITEIEAIKVMIEISSAVEYLHSRNITHRDLKPENIVLQDENDMLSYKLIDLGYAKELGEASASASLVGTLNYVAPELLWKEKYSCSVDYWSLGILFYELITGIRPFLPTMQHTTEWMRHIKNKSYDEIHAYESEGKIIFGKDIQNPTHLSNCLRNKMIEWFRLVLQWDPHKRGKIFDDSGTSRVLVFTMLQHILSKKIMYVFCVPLYKINIYEIDDTTTVETLQSLIEKDTNIEIQHQILTDYNGVLIGNNTPLVFQINEHILFVFKDGCYFTEDIPTDIPTVMEQMLTLSKVELTFKELKNYYRYTIYFTKEQMNLFRLYIFAFSINVDLLCQKINSFNKDMEKRLEDTKALINQIHKIRAMYTSITNKDVTDRREALKFYFEKVDKLVNAADQIKLKFMSLKDNNEKLRDEIKSTDYTKDLSELYNKMCDIYLEITKKSIFNKTKPLDMIKLILKFLNTREERNKDVINMTRKIDKLQNELSTLEKIFNSVTAMTKSYWAEYEKMRLDAYVISQQSNNHQALNISVTELNRIVQPEDDVIYDNLITIHTLENFMAKMQQKFYQVISSDP